MLGAELKYYTVTHRVFSNRRLVGYLVEFENQEKYSGYYTVDELNSVMALTKESMSRRTCKTKSKRLTDIATERKPDINSVIEYIKSITSSEN